jgi:hypothetical protein
MKRLAALLAIAGAMFLTSAAGAREPTQIKTCRTISQPGSYELVDNLTFSGPPSGACLVITADFVTIDLAGFSITGGEFGAVGVLASGQRLRGIAVRNGSLSGFTNDVDLSAAHASIVEGLRVFEGLNHGIIANGIVKGNIAFGVGFGPPAGPAIVATGIVTGNFVTGSRNVGIGIGQGSTVIGNTATGNFREGFVVSCPSNLTDNTAVNNNTIPHGATLVLNGDGCNDTNNVAP